MKPLVAKSFLAKSENTVAQGLLYTFAGVLIAKVISFVRNVFFARILGASEFGLLNLALGPVLSLYPILACGAPMVLARYGSRYAADVRPFILNAALVPSIAGLLFTVIGMVAQRPLALWVLGDPSRAWMIGLAFAATLPLLLFSLSQALHQGLRRFHVRSLSEVLFEVLYCLVGIALILLFSNRGEYCLVAMAGAYTLIVCTLVPLSLRSLRAEPSLRPEPSLASEDVLRRGKRFVLFFGLGFVLAEMSYNGMTFVDRWMVNNFVSSQASGWFVVGTSVAGTVFLGIQTLVQVLVPGLSISHDRQGVEQLDARFWVFIKSSCLAYLLLATVVLLFASPLIRLLFGAQYDDAASLLPILFVAGYFRILYYFGTLFMIAVEQAAGVAYSISAGLVVNIVLDFLLVQRWGAIGVAAAGALALVVASVTILAFTSRYGLRLQPTLFGLMALPLLMLTTSTTYLLPGAVVASSWFLFRPEERRRVMAHLRSLRNFVG